jgi:hypothetical protein
MEYPGAIYDVMNRGDRREPRGNVTDFFGIVKIAELAL